MPEVQLSVDGTLHTGFVSGRVRCSLEQPASTFSLEYDPDASMPDARRSGPIAPSRQGAVIEAGDECVLRVDAEEGGAETLITGFVDKTETDYDPGRRRFTVAGRSHVGDLVDGACMFTPRTWRNKTLDRIATDASTGYRAGVIVLDDVGDAFDRYKYEAGSTVVEVIRKAARDRGFYLFDSPEGDLVLARVGSEDSQTHLRRGENIVSGRRTEDWGQRFSSYHFVGQTRATDELTDDAGRQLMGEIEDPMVGARGRYRPMVVTRSGGKRREDLGKRAVIERNTRAGRSERVTIKVDGFTDGRGLLWRPGVLVTVTDDWLRIQDSRFVVSGCSYSFGHDQPYETELTLTRPEAFDVQDYPVRGRGDLWFTS